VLDQLQVSLSPPGASPLRPLRGTTELRWSTAAPGGFSSCSFTMPGDQRRLIPPLTFVQITLGSSVVWEGLVEDRILDVGESHLSTKVNAFGKQRLLALASVRRMWSRRALAWQAQDPTTKNMDVSQGQIDATSPSTVGLQFTGNNTAFGLNAFGPRYMALVPQGMTVVTFAGTYTETGTATANFELHVESSSDGTTFTDHVTVTGNGTWSVACVGSARVVAVRAKCTTATTPADAAALKQQLTNMRLLGTSLAEDGTGGYFGGTILRDLIPLVPGLYARNVDAGSDFTIQTLERSVRGTAMSIVSEVAGYYQRVWGVWEDGAFDWQTVNLDEVQWIASLANFTSLNLTNTVSNIGKNVYVEYTDPASRAIVNTTVPATTGTGATALSVDFGSQATEASASSSDQRNPFVRSPYTADLILQGGQMTSTQAAQLAAQIATNQGSYPGISGTAVLPLTVVLMNAVKGSTPAALFRAGDNLLIRDLPKTDVGSVGRDGETVFHVASTECDLQAGTITLTLESQPQSIEAQLARLGAA
jgi:hypothetical protein